MRIVTPVARATHRLPDRESRRGFTGRSSLDATVLRMIALNSLAAFTQDVTRGAGLGGGPAPVAPVRSPSPIGPADAAARAAPGGAAPRPLGALPATPPAGPLPRGSLLDLRV